MWEEFQVYRGSEQMNTLMKSSTLWYQIDDLIKLNITKEYDSHLK